MQNIDEMTPDEINAELNTYYEMYYLAGLIKPDEINTLPNLKKWLAEETKQTEKHEYIRHLYDDFRND